MRLNIRLVLAFVSALFLTLVAASLVDMVFHPSGWGAFLLGWMIGLLSLVGTLTLFAPGEM